MPSRADGLKEAGMAKKTKKKLKRSQKIEHTKPLEIVITK